MKVYTVVITMEYPEIMRASVHGKVLDEFATGNTLYRDMKFLVVAECPYNAIQKVLRSKEITDLRDEKVYDCQVIDKQEVTASLI